mmetsp:Transcript_36496/g.112919  ORF Transcript_36496/g.112919 Transcript_36496/m.112919 type:complete len:242 (+) Transcript_36496:1690-2415(+)
MAPSENGTWRTSMFAPWSDWYFSSLNGMSPEPKSLYGTNAPAGLSSPMNSNCPVDEPTARYVMWTTGLARASKSARMSQKYLEGLVVPEPSRTMTFSFWADAAAARRSARASFMAPAARLPSASEISSSAPRPVSVRPIRVRCRVRASSPSFVSIRLSATGATLFRGQGSAIYVRPRPESRGRRFHARGGAAASRAASDAALPAPRAAAHWRGESEFSTIEPKSIGFSRRPCVPELVSDVR